MKTPSLFFLSTSLALLAAPAAARTAAAGPGSKCLPCHKQQTPGLVLQWEQSRHAKNDVGCLDCHEAGRGDPDAFSHHGARVATLVTPKDCGRCHEDPYREVDRSYHATAGLILESADAYLAHAAGGHPAAIAGGESCHGSKVKIDPRSPNKLARESWPNSGIGRLNPDGSKGSCTACHTRHSFSKAQARRPEACGKCHLGPDHPQREIYEESKHGNAYRAHEAEMNLDADSWVVGKDYSAAPTCATCHMSASVKIKRTHDVGERISWTLRPPVSSMKPDWKKKRERMMGVCQACHSRSFAQGHYYQFDGLVQLYNRKFAVPAGQLMALVQERGLLKRKASFGNKLEWIYWELWHHEGRRARHGASMMGPDYTWWHGIYEVAQHFYFKLLPEARKLADPQVNAFIDRLLREDPMHQWLSRPTAEIKADIRSGKMKKMYEQFFHPAQETGAKAPTRAKTRP